MRRRRLRDHPLRLNALFLHPAKAGLPGGRPFFAHPCVNANCFAAPPARPSARRVSLPTALSNALRAGLRAARANLVPGLLLQAAALAIVCAFYFSPSVNHALDRLAQYRTATGFRFSIVSTALCGGIIPFLYLRTFTPAGHRPSYGYGAAITAFWGYKGFEVDLWYRFVGKIFGQDHHPLTVALKTVADQFVYCPILAIPLTVLVYFWTESGFSAGAVITDLRQGQWYARRVLTPLVSNLGIWLPAVMIIYSLPPALQLPMQNIVLVFFTLILSHLMRRTSAAV